MDIGVVILKSVVLLVVYIAYHRIFRRLDFVSEFRFSTIVASPCFIGLALTLGIPLVAVAIGIHFGHQLGLTQGGAGWRVTMQAFLEDKANFSERLREKDWPA